ncbi:hypothetical protein PsYK624_138520 [Phanerochaete sordida]|uniref:RNI-like protein n=1 Tax=Phanerochaete sordida TaxID=48140 RepID=A0A9P3LJK7_9APHY|nr:hypothetical protein PsYK624_138520 [Phanerochaete sordida]
MPHDEEIQAGLFLSRPPDTSTAGGAMSETFLRHAARVGTLRIVRRDVLKIQRCLGLLLHLRSHHTSLFPKLRTLNIDLEELYNPDEPDIGLPNLNLFLGPETRIATVNACHLVTQQLLVQLPLACPQLRKLEVERLPAGYTGVLRAFAALESFRCTNPRPYSEWDSINLPILGSLPSLHHLTLHLPNVDGSSLGLCIGHGALFTALETLTLSSIEAEYGLLDFLRLIGSPRLRELYLSVNDGVGTRAMHEVLEFIPAKFPTLRILSIDSYGSFGPDTPFPPEPITALQHLEDLSLCVNGIDLTYAGALRLCEAWPGLLWLAVSCSDTRYEAAKWPLSVLECFAHRLPALEYLNARLDTAAAIPRAASARSLDPIRLDIGKSQLCEDHVEATATYIGNVYPNAVLELRTIDSMSPEELRWQRVKALLKLQRGD